MFPRNNPRCLVLVRSQVLFTP
uniref:Uncharacterized protein n=1 Tax=Arundo donax TaxID=35708 RepID=A0A0A8ZTI8_ARUDO